MEEVICADQPSPPSVDDAPEYLRADLKALEKLSNEELRRLAESHLEPAKQRKLSRLLDKNQAGTITKKEHQQLDELLQEGQRLMVIKAQAWVLLQWRGERIPTYEELRRCSQRRQSCFRILHRLGTFSLPNFRSLLSSLHAHGTCCI
jgi:hypothetical protein